jgi:non-heme chloroperoxidase
MSTITTKDGTQIYYKDCGFGQPVVFSHGWPLSADAWESQMFFLASHGCRCIAHDRRGHGRSSQPWNGNEMDTYADDLAELFKALDLKGATMIGHSAGGGEVARYIGRHGASRVAKAVLVSAVPPLMLKTKANPGGLPIAVFDGIRAASAANRAQLYKDLASGPFFGFNRPGARLSPGTVDSFWMQGMMGGHKNTYDCIKAFKGSGSPASRHLQLRQNPVNYQKQKRNHGYSNKQTCRQGCRRHRSFQGHWRGHRQTSCSGRRRVRCQLRIEPFPNGKVEERAEFSEPIKKS